MNLLDVYISSYHNQLFQESKVSGNRIVTYVRSAKERLPLLSDLDVILLFLDVLNHVQYGSKPVSYMRSINLRDYQMETAKYNTVEKLEAISFIRAYMSIKRTVMVYQAAEKCKLDFFDIKPISACSVLSLMRVCLVGHYYPLLTWDKCVILPHLVYSGVVTEYRSLSSYTYFELFKSDCFEKIYRVWYNYSARSNKDQMAKDFWDNLSDFLKENSAEGLVGEHRINNVRTC